MGGESRRVLRDADTDRAAVAGRVINSIGNSHPAGIRSEVGIIHQDRRAVPLGAAVFEVADHFAFLAVHTDDGQALPLEAGPQRADVLELLIAIGAGVGSDLLAVNAQREMHLVEQTCDRVSRDGNVELLEYLGDLLGGLAGPFQPGDGISRRIVLQ